MGKRLLALVMTVCLLAGCAPKAAEEKQYTATFLELFDTVTTIVGKAESQEAFTQEAQAIRDALLPYHQLFDIYHDYEGVTNLKQLNDHAAQGPVAVDRVLLDFLLDCKDYCQLTGGKVNVAMGSVLELWHEKRTAGIEDPRNASLPEKAALDAAAEHISFDSVMIDEAAGTVFFSDPMLKLDAGAVAKGWAAQRVAENAPEGLLISVGGNVCATGPKDADGTPWVVGVNNPDGGSYLHTLNITGGSLVTSGDYQRYYTVDGKIYHHIIDPETRMPSAYWRSVTILCDDSGLADALSTALFLLPLEEGQALLNQTGAEAMWVDAQGEIFMSPGFSQYIRT